MKHYPVDESDKGTLIEQSLNRLVTYFRRSNDLVNEYNGELLEFL